MLTKIPCRQRMKLCARARKWFYSVVIILWDLILKKCWLYLNCLPVIHLQCCFCWQPRFSVLSTTYSHPADLNCRCSSYILNLTGYPSRNYLASLSAAGAAIRKGGFWKTVQDGFDISKVWEFSFAFHRKTLKWKAFMCCRRKFFTLLRDGRWENKNRTFHWYPACCTCQCPASYLQQISKFRDKPVVRLQPVSGICVCGCFPFLCMCVITLPRPIRTFSPAIFPARLETGVVFGFQFCFSVIHRKSGPPGCF